MIFVFIPYFLIAALDWVAVAKGWKKVEYIAKPVSMLILLGPLVLVASFGSVPLICFSLGIFFSLVGDVFLMLSYARFSDRWFLPGLAAFLLAHVAYIIGLNIPMPDVSPLWSLGLGIILALTAARPPASHPGRGEPERPGTLDTPGGIVRDDHHSDAALGLADAL